MIQRGMPVLGLSSAGPIRLAAERTPILEMDRDIASRASLPPSSRACCCSVVPAPVDAHAERVLASPEPGTGLAQAPAAVVIKFSEPLNVPLPAGSQSSSAWVHWFSRNRRNGRSVVVRIAVAKRPWTTGVASPRRRRPEEPT
jgi:methionine-rich copper-binding protein CopC